MKTRLVYENRKKNSNPAPAAGPAKYWRHLIKPELRNLRDTIRFHLVADEQMAKRFYQREFRADLNLTNPQNYFEKLWWLVLNDRNPLLTLCTDKVAVRDYVTDAGLAGILNEVYGVYERAEDIDFRRLPPGAFIKTTHGSGGNALWDPARPFDTRLFRLRFNRALRHNYYYSRREWNYANIEPRLIAERFIDQEPLIDYRFLCFNGVVRLVYIDVGVADRDGAHALRPRRNVHAPDFSIIPAKVVWDNYTSPKLEKPADWELMIEYAERLSAPFPHCRVDMYNTGEQVLFGELTFYPGGVLQRPIAPTKLEDQMGEWLDISDLSTDHDP